MSTKKRKEKKRKSNLKPVLLKQTCIIIQNNLLPAIRAQETMFI